MFKNIIAIAIAAAFSTVAFAGTTPVIAAKTAEPVNAVATTPAPVAEPTAAEATKPEMKVEKKAKHKAAKKVAAVPAATKLAAPEEKSEAVK